MASTSHPRIPFAIQPRTEDYDYDVDAALASVVGLRATIPSDAFTAETLGTERGGNGVIIGDGLVLTIGYLITEASSVWLHLSDGRTMQAHVLGYDQETGFGLLQALGRLDLPALPLGDSAKVRVGDPVVVGGVGGRGSSVGARVIAKQEFAGYWEYLLDEALFTAPSHPNWGGTALIGKSGELLGIGSLQLQQSEGPDAENLNMIVPIDLLKPILTDLQTLGRRNAPARPWLGFFAAEIDDKVAVVGLSRGSPAEKAKLEPGDIILAVDGHEVTSLAGLFRSIWAVGEAGVEIPLLVYRERRAVEVRVRSRDRNRFLKGPVLH